MVRGFTDEDDKPRHEDGDEDSAPVRVDNCRCIGATPKAIRVEIHGRPTWIPQSVITDMSEVYAAGHVGTLEVAGWFARKEGIEP